MCSRSSVNLLLCTCVRVCMCVILPVFVNNVCVWTNRDFAYVARDRSTRKHMCHVFRCDMPARTIANTLRDICKKIMIERSLQQNLAKPIDINGRVGLATRPTNLPTEHRRSNRNSQALVSKSQSFYLPSSIISTNICYLLVQLIQDALYRYRTLYCHVLTAQSFPTPMEEPKKVLRAQYLGYTQVQHATGMNVLNDAIDQLVTTVPRDQWQSVNVAIAPSMISILQPNVSNTHTMFCMYTIYITRVIYSLGWQTGHRMSSPLSVILRYRP